MSEPCANDCASSVEIVAALGCCIVKVLGNFEDSFLFFPLKNELDILLQTCLGPETNFTLLRVSSVKNVNLVCLNQRKGILFSHRDTRHFTTDTTLKAVMTCTESNSRVGVIISETK